MVRRRPIGGRDGFLAQSRGDQIRRGPRQHSHPGVWNKLNIDVNVILDAPYWGDSLSEAIRGVKLTNAKWALWMHTAMRESPSPHFLKSLRWRREEIALFENDRKQMKDASATMTVDQHKKFAKSPRLPPTDWSSTFNLLTTYYFFWKMVFGINAHKCGLDHIQDQEWLSVKSRTTRTCTTICTSQRWYGRSRMTRSSSLTNTSSCRTSAPPTTPFFGGHDST